MTLQRLDRTGHTELTDLSSEQLIKELETDMNKGKCAIADAPGRESTYVRDGADLEGWPADTVVTVMPQLRGGSA